MAIHIWLPGQRFGKTKDADGPAHAPAGSSKGGQFVSGSGGSGGGSKAKPVPGHSAGAPAAKAYPSNPHEQKLYHHEAAGAALKKVSEHHYESKKLSKKDLDLYDKIANAHSGAQHATTPGMRAKWHAEAQRHEAQLSTEANGGEAKSAAKTTAELAKHHRAEFNRLSGANADMTKQSYHRTRAMKYEKLLASEQAAKKKTTPKPTSPHVIPSGSREDRDSSGHHT